MIRAVYAMGWVAIVSCGPSESPEVVPGGVVLNENVATIGDYDIAPEEGGFVVVWSELPQGEPGEELYLAHLDAGARLVQPPRLVTNLDTTGYTNLRVQATPSGYLVWYYRQDRPLRALVLDRDANILAEQEPVNDLSCCGRVADVAISGDAVGVVWRLSSTLRFQVFNDQAVARSSTTDLESGNYPFVAFANDRFEVVWTDDDDVRRASFDVDGELTRPAETIASDTDANNARATGVPGGLFVGWRRDDAAGQGVMFRYLSDDGSGWSESRTLFAANRFDSQDFRLATSGPEVAVSWETDATRAVTGGMFGTIAPGLGELALEDTRELAVPGVRAGASLLAGSPDAVVGLLRVTVDGRPRLFSQRHLP